MRGAKSVLINVSGGHDMKLFEVDEAANRKVQEEVDPSANIIFGATFDDSLEGELRVAVVATGIHTEEELEDSASPYLASHKSSTFAPEEEAKIEPEEHFSHFSEKTSSINSDAQSYESAMLGSTHTTEELLRAKSEEDNLKLTGSFFNANEKESADTQNALQNKPLKHAPPAPKALNL